MTAKPKSNEQDQALAAYTDAVLEGRVPETDVAPELRVAVHRLASTLQPAAPPETLRQRVLRRVRLEWAATRAPWWEGIVTTGRGLARSLTRVFARHPAWGAMTALVLLGLLVAFLTSGDVETVGTVVAPAKGAWAAILVAALLLAGVVVWLRRRR